MFKAENGGLDVFGHPFGVPLGDAGVQAEPSLTVVLTEESTLANQVMADQEITLYSHQVPADDREQVEVTLPEKLRASTLGPWVVSSKHGRIDRSRDSRDSYADRQFDKRTGYAAARAERRSAKRKGLQRVWAAPDGYLPGETPPKRDRWNSQRGSAALAEAEAEVTPEPKRVFTSKEWILKSPEVELAFIELEAEREKQQQLELQAVEASAAAEIEAFQATQEADTEASLEAVLMDRPSPEIVVTIREHLQRKLSRQAAYARARQVGASAIGQPAKPMPEKGSRNPYLSAQPFARGIERPESYMFTADKEALEVA